MTNARFKATLNGETLGWFDTAAEAQECLDMAVEAKEHEDADYIAWLEK